MIKFHSFQIDLSDISVHLRLLNPNLLCIYFNKPCVLQEINKLWSLYKNKKITLESTIKAQVYLLL